VDGPVEPVAPVAQAAVAVGSSSVGLLRRTGMKVRTLICTAAAAALVVPVVVAQGPQAGPAAAAAQVQQAPPIRVFIRAGLKTHAEGQHDYPQFLSDWSKLLTARGAVVDGGLHFPSAEALANTDVIVMYKGDAGYMTMRERAALEDFLARGGGLIGMHDAICADDEAWWATIFGGAKRHGETNFTLEAPVAYTIDQPAHPIMQGMTPFTITDEAFFKMTWADAPGIQTLASAPMADTPSAKGFAGTVVPQIWTYERNFFPRLCGQTPFRAFVWMQGHNYVNFTHAQVQPMLLRAIAWAAKRPVDALATERPARGGGGRRGGGPGGRGGAAGAPGGARGGA
jgi:type 1 glutamine amidotransferase